MAQKVLMKMWESFGIHSLYCVVVFDRASREDQLREDQTFFFYISKNQNPFQEKYRFVKRKFSMLIEILSC